LTGEIGGGFVVVLPVGPGEFMASRAHAPTEEKLAVQETLSAADQRSAVAKECLIPAHYRRGIKKLTIPASVFTGRAEISLSLLKREWHPSNGCAEAP
jgi:hypothetical protein